MGHAKKGGGLEYKRGEKAEKQGKEGFNPTT
jgi:hypothetical protein